MAASADNDMIMHDDAERAGDVDDGFGHLHIGLRRRGVAGGVVMQQATMQAIAVILLGF